jgi:hypothetical protein
MSWRFLKVFRKLLASNWGLCFAFIKACYFNSERTKETLDRLYKAFEFNDTELIMQETVRLQYWERIKLLIKDKMDV